MIVGFLSGFTKPASAVFNPATLSLTGWWRANFPGDPWGGTASAGSSGTPTLITSNVTPTSGTAQNGLTPAAFNGTSQDLKSTTQTASLVSSSAGSIVCLFKAAAAATDSGTDYTAYPALFGDLGLGRVGLTYSSSGVRCGYYDSSTFQSVATAAATGSYHLAMGKWDGTTLSVQVDSNAAVTVARGSANLFTVSSLVGANSAESAYFNGTILELMTAQSALSSTNYSNIKSYVNSRYALAL